MAESTDDLLHSTAEVVGHVLGRAAAVVDAAKTHGEEIVVATEKRLETGQEQVAATVAKVRVRAKRAVKNAKKVVHTAAKRVAKARKTTRKVVVKGRRTAKKAVAKGRKTAKKAVAKARKAAKKRRR